MQPMQTVTLQAKEAVTPNRPEKRDIYMDTNNIQHNFGAIQSLPDIRDYTLCKSSIAMNKIPECIKTYINGPVKIKSQGNKPTCVAYALSSLVEFHDYKDTQKYTRFSTNFIYGCRYNTDYFGEGMYLRDGLKVIQKFGDVEYSRLPGNAKVERACKLVDANFEELSPYAYPNRISAYYKIKSLKELRYSLYNDGPVIACMYWYEDSGLDKNNMYQYDISKDKSAHAVLILGWDENNLVVQNSWGLSFGDRGLFYVPISKLSEVFVELYGVTDNITNVKHISKPMLFISPIINKILRWVYKHRK